ncbi:MAG TPA: hypothetical protein PLP23_02275 [Panacibacter sp.]|nr:hypothetical protein [Panacibacter sp.]
MKHLKFSLLAATTLFAVTITKAQTVDDIIAKHTEAMGGADKISQVNSMYIESSIQAMGNESPNTTIILNGKGYKTESEMMGSKMVQVYTDKGGWMINPMMGASAPTPMDADLYKSGEDQLYAAGGLIDYAAKGNKAELLGQEQVASVNAWKIKLTNKDGIETTYYIDPSTYYIIQIVKQVSMMGQNMDLTITPSDYKKTDQGLVVAYSTGIDYGGQFSMTTTIKKIEINKTIDPAIFEMPK